MCSAGRTHMQSGHAGAVQTQFVVLGFILKNIKYFMILSQISHLLEPILLHFGRHFVVCFHLMFKPPKKSKDRISLGTSAGPVAQS